jgi:hypothetical protein
MYGLAVGVLGLAHFIALYIDDLLIFIVYKCSVFCGVLTNYHFDFF